jgi:hypothetical protein
VLETTPDGTYVSAMQLPELGMSLHFTVPSHPTERQIAKASYHGRGSGAVVNRADRTRVARTQRADSEPAIRPWCLCLRFRFWVRTSKKAPFLALRYECAVPNRALAAEDQKAVDKIFRTSLSDKLGRLEL